MSDGAYGFYTLGLDLGQQSDFTALALLEEQVYWEGSWQSPQMHTPTRLRYMLDAVEEPLPHKPPLHMRGLKRWDLGTKYPEIVRDVLKAMQRVEMLARGVTLVVDATGVGRPVLDLFVEAGIPVVGVTITGGKDVGYDQESGEFTVPKRQLVAAVTAQLQTKRLQIAGTMREVPILTRELLSFKVTIKKDTAHDSYGAWREGDHDDLVLATALACWHRDHTKRHWDDVRVKSGEFSHATV